jgi:hypothetical protein
LNLASRGQMTLADADIRRAAAVLIHNRGHQARIARGMRADESRSTGETDGERQRGAASWGRSDSLRA